jgi:MYXO-CTERM domain-containing protein
MTTNSSAAPLAGWFNGGNPYFLPSPYAAGDSITFQVRAWSLSGGLSYEEAFAVGASTGKSGLGFTTLGGGLVLPGALFGTSAGQVGTFSIAPVPEPSSIAIGLLGLGAIALFRRRK